MLCGTIVVTTRNQTPNAILIYQCRQTAGAKVRLVKRETAQITV